MRSFDIRAVAVAIGVTEKWIDNLLASHELLGIQRGRQGVRRRVTEDGLLALDITRLLTTELGLPVRVAAILARNAVSDQDAETVRVQLPSGIALHFPIAELRNRLRVRILDAVDATLPVRRGRPPRDAQKRTPDT